MGFEEAMKILDQYDEGVPPRTIKDLGCGCGCKDEDSRKKCPRRAVLAVKNLHVSVHGKEVLKGVDLTVRQGEVHVLMGPNGAGKSTLAMAIAGHPAYEISKGTVTLNSKNVLGLEPDERARLGIFLAFQNPQEIDINLGTFLFHLYKARYGKDAKAADFNRDLNASLKALKLDRAFIDRQLNVGFSGGEKKKVEMLQLLLTKPAFAIFDETDSGLDIDALRVVRDAFNKIRGPCLGVILITHLPKHASKMEPDSVHIMMNGAITQTDGPALIDKIEKEGYGEVKLKVV
jgi:Fe-S cluster assembly ATP-binding protein